MECLGQTMPVSQTPDSLSDLQRRMREFARERDWEQFHDPKSLILALVGEVGELAELFQWLPADKSADLANRSPLQQRVGEEMGDILLYLVRIADVAGIDLASATEAKFASVQEGFPVDQVKGDAPIKD